MTNFSRSAFDHVIQGAAHHLFQDSIDPIVLTDLAGIIAKANEQTFAFLGKEQNELYGHNIATIYQPEQRLPDFSTLQTGSLQAFSAVIPGKTKRSHLHVQVQATSYTLGESDIVQWVLHDVTRQVELDQMRQDLAAMLVHDLQGPLGNILSSLELVRKDLPSDSSDTLLAMVDVAYRSSQHLEALVSSMMDISHLEAGHPIADFMPIKIADLFDYVVAVEESDLEQRGITPVQSIAPGLPRVLGNESMLRRVLLNLLDNALKFSQQGRAITIKAAPDEDRNMVRFSVVDQGQGVPEVYRDLIFEKFQRIRSGSSSSGLGLGLAFCRLAVEAHGGAIWVEDAPAGGACFCFTVPAAVDEAS